MERRREQINAYRKLTQTDDDDTPVIHGPHLLEVGIARLCARSGGVQPGTIIIERSFAQTARKDC